MIVGPGTRLRSQVCTTEVVVVRAPSGEISLSCGGADLLPLEDDTPVSGVPMPGLDTGTLLGKRYVDDTGRTLELLVTQAGWGTLASGSRPLVVKETKALPASD